MFTLRVEPRVDLLGEWRSHIQEWHNCTKCKIGCKATRHVLGEGTLPCDVLFIGEGPGQSEDALGRPFIGASGKLLRMAIEFSRDEDHYSWFITNTVACRPIDIAGKNRQPDEDERANCWPRVKDVIRMAGEPGELKIVLVGNVAANTVMDRIDLHHEGYDVLQIKHPAYILRRGGPKSSEYKGLLRALTRFVKSRQ